MKLKNLSLLILLLAGTLFITSCGDDGDGGIIDKNGPTLKLENESGFVTSTAEVDLGAIFQVKLTATKGDADLKTLTIYEDGTKVDLSRITINGSADSNPKLLLGNNVDGFTFEIAIPAPSTIGTYSYAYTVEDDKGEATSASVSITTKGEPLSLEYFGSTIKFIPAGTLSSARLVATKGSSELTTVGVYINDELVVTVGDLSFDGTPFDENPFSIPSEDIDEFDRMIGFRAPSEPGVYDITIKVMDAANYEEEINFKVSTEISLTKGVFFNVDGPNFGGLDLHTIEARTKGSPDSEIEDAGIDLDLPAESNWKKQIVGVNGSTLQYMIAGSNGLAEDFSFGSIAFKEDLAAISTNGIAFDNDNPKALQIGDLILVSNNEEYFLIEVKEINNTPSDNLDYYVFDVKK